MRPNPTNFVGQRFGNLVVMENGTKENGRRCVCKCDCGKETTARPWDLIHKFKLSCGCRKTENGIKRIKSLLNFRFSRLLVIEYAGLKNHHAMWKCKCECGNITIIPGYKLTCGEYTSCGCYRRESARRGKGPGEAARHSTYMAYKRNAQKRSLEFSITEEEFDRVVRQPCIYCGNALTNNCTDSNNGNYRYTGIDRTDNSLGYTTKNIVPCCSICNWMKETLSLHEFFGRILAISTFSTTQIKPTPEFEKFLSNGVGVAAMNAVYKEYFDVATKKKRTFDLSHEEFYSLTQQPCAYCGALPSNKRRLRGANGSYTYNGIDRVDNTKGYEKDNVVPCCIDCNRMKSDMSEQEFRLQVSKILEALKEKKSLANLVVERKAL